MPTADKKLRPTVIESLVGTPRNLRDAHAPRPDPAALSASPAATARVVRQPTAIPGAERQRIVVQAGELERLSPGAAPEVYKQATTLIAGFVADKATERKAILWGHDLQKAYSDLVSEALVLSRSPVLHKAERYLARTTDILGSIDLLAASGHGSAGLMARLFERANDRIDTPGELLSAQVELERLVALMAGALEQLLDLKDRMLRLAERTDAAGAQTQAAAIAATFLSGHLPRSKVAVAQRFSERAMSLTQTVALIREGSATRTLQLEQPIRMVSAIQNVALVMLPGFIGSIAALSATRSAVTPTEAGELTYRLRDLTDRLKAWHT